MLDDLERFRRTNHHEVDLTVRSVRRERGHLSFLAHDEPMLREARHDPITASGVEIPCEDHWMLGFAEVAGEEVRLRESLFGSSIEVDPDDGDLSALPGHRDPHVERRPRLGTVRW